MTLSYKFKYLAVGGAVLCPLFLLSSVAVADFIPDNSELSGILNSVKLPNTFEQVLTGWSQRYPLLNTILKKAIGSLGCEIFSSCGNDLPDPYTIREDGTERQTANPTGDILSASSTVRARDLANLYDQELSRASAAPFLGKQGKQWAIEQNNAISQVIQSNQKAGQQVQQLATEAQGKNVTQEVIKTQTQIETQLAGMMINQGQLSSQISSSLLSLQQQQGALIQLAANSSEGIDESNRRERVSRDALLMQGATAQVYIPGLYQQGD